MASSNTKSAMNILGEIGWSKLVEGNGLDLKEMIDIAVDIAKQHEDAEVRLKAVSVFKDLMNAIVTKLPPPAMSGDGQSIFDLSTLDKDEKEIFLRAATKAVTNKQ
jgi:hypothetical protein